MSFTSLITRARASYARHRRYRQMVDEINGLDERDLADLRTSRADMLYQIRQQIYG